MAEDRSSGHGDTLYEERGPTAQAATLHGVPQALTPPAPQAAPALPEKPVFVSMKPPSEPGARKTPRVPAIDRPELRPRLRPMTDPLRQSRAQTAGSLGRYAPPCSRRSPHAPRAVLWIYALLAVAAALLGAGAALWIRSAW